MAKVVIVSNTLTYMIRFRRELLETMQSLGHDVVVLSPVDGYAKGEGRLPVKWREVPLIQHGMNPFHEMHTICVIYGVLRKVRPDLVINFTIKPSIYGSIAASLARVPRIVSVFTGLGYWFTRPGAPVLERVIQFALRRALRSNELVFFQNEDDRTLFVERQLITHSKARIVDGSGVNISDYAPRGAPSCSGTFLFVGRLLREKGVREFVAAARHVRTRWPDARFVLVGPIDTSRSAIRREEVQEWVNKGIVEYLGEVSDVREIVAQSSVLVLPSYREGTPRSVLEAMAMGKPVITTNVPGCRETVRDGVNGFLVPAADADALAQAMMRFLVDPGLICQYGAESRKIAVERYDVRKVNSSFLRQVGLQCDII